MVLRALASHQCAWGPFVERPGNLTGPKSYFEIKVWRKVGRVLTSNEVHFVSLADNFTVPFSKLLKLPSLMEKKTHEFIIDAMRQRTRADDLTICYHKKQIDVSF